MKKQDLFNFRGLPSLPVYRSAEFSDPRSSTVKMLPAPNIGRGRSTRAMSILPKLGFGDPDDEKEGEM